MATADGDVYSSRLIAAINRMPEPIFDILCRMLQVQCPLLSTPLPWDRRDLVQCLRSTKISSDMADAIYNCIFGARLTDQIIRTFRRAPKTQYSRLVMALRDSGSEAVRLVGEAMDPDDGSEAQTILQDRLIGKTLAQGVFAVIKHL